MPLTPEPQTTGVIQRGSSGKTLLWATAALVFLLLLLLIVILSPSPKTPIVQFTVATPPVVSNGFTSVTFVLSNTTPRTLNIVDDRSGGPVLTIEAGTYDDPPGSGQRGYWAVPPGSTSAGVWLTLPANTLTLNLAEGETISRTVVISNAPPRYRLAAHIRDLSLERRQMPLQMLRALALKAHLITRKRYDSGFSPPRPTSIWITNFPATMRTPQSTIDAAVTQGTGLPKPR